MEPPDVTRTGSSKASFTSAGSTRTLKRGEERLLDFEDSCGNAFRMQVLDDSLTDGGIIFRLTPIQRSSKSSERATRNAGLLDALTKRERDIARLVEKGYSNDSIAQELFISSSTVKSHLCNIYRKMNVSSKLELSSLLHGNA